MIWLDILWIIIAVILLMGVEYIAYLYINTNSNRQFIITLWCVVIAILYFASYAFLSSVSHFNTERVMPILIFFITLGLIKAFYTKGDE